MTADFANQIITGDNLDVMATLPPGSVELFGCGQSPISWRLRPGYAR